jgi:hypothetical protein
MILILVVVIVVKHTSHNGFGLHVQIRNFNCSCTYHMHYMLHAIIIMIYLKEYEMRDTIEIQKRQVKPLACCA